MDWLSLHHAETLCYEKVVRMNLIDGETLIVYRDELGNILKLISCIRAQRYLHKKCYAFLAHI